ncbi:MAG: zinc ribbon domain-containing protein [Clostridia bacterium]|nr:zinc ribbon domain-containing protein [Clostridia bacterium]
MAFCGQCGKEIEENQNFCPFCGASQGESPAAAEEKVGGDDKLMAVLSYFGLLVLIPIFAAKERPFARFHANQGLVLFIVELAWGIVSGIVGGIFAVLGFGIVGELLELAELLLLVLAIIGIVNACKGEKKELPVIGKFQILN